MLVKRFDKIIIAVMIIFVIVSTVMSLMPKAESDQIMLRISMDGEVVKELKIDKSTNEEIILETHDNDGYNLVKIENGNVSIIEADCPGQYCVTKGEISKAGEIIVCLPHKLTVELVGKKTDDIDFISE